VDLPCGTHLLEHVGPDRDAHLAEVGLAEQEHRYAGLADAAADRERDPVLEDRAVVRQLEEAELARQLELTAECLRFVTGFQTRMSPFSPCIGRPSADTVSVTQSS
jgi:hypothetical protein